MANLAGVVQPLQKERDLAARRSNGLTRRLLHSLATHTGKGRDAGDTCRQQQGRGSRLPRERDGRR